jgi:methionyl-tRNA formyltransferase
MATPAFACPSLELLSRKERLVGVVTQPPRPSGRGGRINPSSVERLAKRKNIPFYQSRNVNSPSFITRIERIAPDIVVVVAFGQILSPDFLSIPGICSLNLHPSLLPRYRGAAPIPWAIIRGDRETGVTVQRIEEGVDEGRIIVQEKIPISFEDTAGDLEDRLSLLGAELLLKTIKMIKEGSAKYTIQNEKQVTYAPKIRKEDGLIRWEKSSYHIHNLVRGLNPYPGAFTFIRLREKKVRVKIWQTGLMKEELLKKKKARPGEVVGIKKGKGLLVKAGEGILLIRKVQLAGRNHISGYDFVKGYQIKEGFMLGKYSV